MFNDFKRLKRVEERLDAVERMMKALELEWSNVYDKVRTTLAKLAKREERAAGEATPTSHSSAAGVAVSSSLSPRAQEIQQQILARRNRLQQNGAGDGLLPTPNGKAT